MGTQWKISLGDTLSEKASTELFSACERKAHEFDASYSRFRADSLVTDLSGKTGIQEVPTDLTQMLRIYEILYHASDGALSPLVGFAISDLGYDASYSFQKKAHIRSVPKFTDALSIIDDTHIELREHVLLDIGAIGKGYFLDRLKEFMLRSGIEHFLLDGSGDIVYRSPHETITAGLEHPSDATKVIGSIELRSSSLCASGGNRRQWGGMHHIIDPTTLSSPQEILGTWVLAESAALADGIATALFLVTPEMLEDHGIPHFEYCIMNSASHVKRSKDFSARLY